MSGRRRLPAGIRRRGAVCTCTWRDHLGRQYSRKAGDTLPEAEAFKRRIDDQLAIGTYRASSTLIFAAHASSWIEVAPLEQQTRDAGPDCVHAAWRATDRPRASQRLRASQTDVEAALGPAVEPSA